MEKLEYLWLILSHFYNFSCLFFQATKDQYHYFIIIYPSQLLTTHSHINMQTSKQTTIIFIHYKFCTRNYFRFFSLFFEFFVVFNLCCFRHLNTVCHDKDLFCPNNYRLNTKRNSNDNLCSFLTIHCLNNKILFSLFKNKGS